MECELEMEVPVTEASASGGKKRKSGSSGRGGSVASGSGSGGSVASDGKRMKEEPKDDAYTSQDNAYTQSNKDGMRTDGMRTIYHKLFDNDIKVYTN